MSKFYNEKFNEFYTHCLGVAITACRICAGVVLDAQHPAASSQVPSPLPSSKMASTSSSSPFASVVSPLANVYDRFSQWRSALGLSNPGTVENLTKEVKCELRLSLHHHHAPSLPFRLRATSHFTRPLKVGNSRNPQLKTMLQQPTSPISSSTVPGPISRKTSRFRHCSKSPTLSRWLRKRHLQHTTLVPYLRITRLVTLQ